MVAMLASLILSPKIAYVARYYFPFPDKRISKFRLYVCDWDGGRKRALTPSAQDVRQIAWAGPNRIVYEVSVGTEFHWRSEIWTVALNRGKPKRVAPSNASLTKDFELEYWGDGQPVITREGDTATYSVDARTGRLVKKSPSKVPWLDPVPDLNKGKRPSVTKSTDSRHPGAVRWDEGETTLTVGSKSVKGDFLTWRGFWLPRTNELWFEDTYSRDARDIWKVNWKDVRFEKLFTYGYFIDWRPDRRKLAYTTPRDVSPYGPIKVLWTSELWVGDLPTGAKRPLISGLVDIHDVAVQPTN